jgi:hypothetical protein
MRTLILTPLAVLLAINPALPQEAPSNWGAWVSKVRPLVAAKDAGIKETIAIRNDVCPRQPTAEKQKDCVDRLAKIIDRRKREKVLLSGMVDAATRLKDGEGYALVEIVNPVFQQMNKETDSMMLEAQALYPR